MGMARADQTTFKTTTISQNQDWDLFLDQKCQVPTSQTLSSILKKSQRFLTAIGDGPC